jgi:hypothetical protein
MHGKSLLAFTHLEFLDRVDEVQHVLLFCGLVNAVPQVHDVVHTLSLAEDVVDFPGDDFLVGVEHHGVHVSLEDDGLLQQVAVLVHTRRLRIHTALKQLHVLLHVDLGADVLKVVRPVDVDDVGAGAHHLIQERTHALVHEQDQRHVGVALLHTGNDVLVVVPRELLVQLGGQVASPTIEQLHNLRAIGDLVLYVLDDIVCQLAEEQVCSVGVLIHELLRLHVGATRATLDHYMDQSEQTNKNNANI